MIDSRSRDDTRFCIIDAVYRDAVSYEFPRETNALIALLWRWEYKEGLPSSAAKPVSGRAR